MASCVVSRNLTVVACFAGKELIQTVEIAPFYKKSAPPSSHLHHAGSRTERLVAFVIPSGTTTFLPYP